MKTITFKIPGEYSLMPIVSVLSHVPIMWFIEKQNISAHTDLASHLRVQCLISHQINNPMIS